MWDFFKFPHHSQLKSALISELHHPIWWILFPISSSLIVPGFPRPAAGTARGDGVCPAPAQLLGLMIHVADPTSAASWEGHFYSYLLKCIWEDWVCDVGIGRWDAKAWLYFWNAVQMWCIRYIKPCPVLAIKKKKKSKKRNPIAPSIRLSYPLSQL